MIFDGDWRLIVSVLVLGAAICFSFFWVWIAYRATLKGSFSKVRSPLIIFDFDGTICPSYPLFIEQVNSLAHEYHFRKIGEDETEMIKGMTPGQIMKKLGVSKFKLPFLLNKARGNIQKQLLDLEPVEGMVDLLIELKNSGCSLGILTSNSAENVSLYVKRYGIDLFDFIYAGNNIFGKEGHLQKILKGSGLREVEVVYIGDEGRDMEAAHRVSLKGIAVTWGYNSADLLRRSGHSVLCDSPEQLRKVLESQ